MPVCDVVKDGRAMIHASKAGKGARLEAAFEYEHKAKTLYCQSAVSMHATEA